MVLEATMICLDNSEWSRNGDFSPNRLTAQQETANLLCGAKTQANPENAVGLLNMGGPRVSVAVAPTPDMGEFLQALHGIPSIGKSDYLRGVQIAQLALKHRLNRNQRQRIVLFVCSPMDVTEKQVEILGKNLKKNNIALDIISFGEVARNSKLLQKLYLAVNSNDTSHLVEVAENNASLTRVVMQSSVVAVDLPSAASMDFSGIDGVGELGVDPAADPELYMALRLSLEEERARQRREVESHAAGTAEMRAGHDAVVPVASTPEGEITMSSNCFQDGIAGPSHGVEIIDDTVSLSREDFDEDKPPTVDQINAMDIDTELREALILSLKDYDVTPETEPKKTKEEDNTPAQASSKRVAEADEENHATIIDDSNKRRKTDDETPQLDFQTPESEVSARENPADDPPCSSSSHPSNLNDVIKHISGVNFDDPEVQRALRSITKKDEQDEDDEEFLSVSKCHNPERAWELKKPLTCQIKRYNPSHQRRSISPRSKRRISPTTQNKWATYPRDDPPRNISPTNHRSLITSEPKSPSSHPQYSRRTRIEPTIVWRNTPRPLSPLACPSPLRSSSPPSPRHCSPLRHIGVPDDRMPSPLRPPNSTHKRRSPLAVLSSLPLKSRRHDANMDQRPRREICVAEIYVARPDRPRFNERARMSSAASSYYHHGDNDALHSSRGTKIPDGRTNDRGQRERNTATKEQPNSNLRITDDDDTPPRVRRGNISREWSKDNNQRQRNPLEIHRNRLSTTSNDHFDTAAEQYYTNSQAPRDKSPATTNCQHDAGSHVSINSLLESEKHYEPRNHSRYDHQKSRSRWDDRSAAQRIILPELPESDTGPVTGRSSYNTSIGDGHREIEPHLSDRLKSENSCKVEAGAAETRPNAIRGGAEKGDDSARNDEDQFVGRVPCRQNEPVDLGLVSKKELTDDPAGLDLAQERIELISKGAESLLFPELRGVSPISIPIPPNPSIAKIMVEFERLSIVILKTRLGLSDEDIERRIPALKPVRYNEFLRPPFLGDVWTFDIDTYVDLLHTGQLDDNPELFVSLESRIQSAEESTTYEDILMTDLNSGIVLVTSNATSGADSSACGGTNQNSSETNASPPAQLSPDHGVCEVKFHTSPPPTNNPKPAQPLGRGTPLYPDELVAYYLDETKVASGHSKRYEALNNRFDFITRSLLWSLRPHTGGDDGFKRPRNIPSQKPSERSTELNADVMNVWMVLMQEWSDQLYSLRRTKLESEISGSPVVEIPFDGLFAAYDDDPSLLGLLPPAKTLYLSTDFMTTFEHALAPKFDGSATSAKIRNRGFTDNELYSAAILAKPSTSFSTACERIWRFFNRKKCIPWDWDFICWPINYLSAHWVLLTIDVKKRELVWSDSYRACYVKAAKSDRMPITQIPPVVQPEETQQDSRPTSRIRTHSSLPFALSANKLTEPSPISVSELPADLEELLSSVTAEEIMRSLDENKPNSSSSVAETSPPSGGRIIPGDLVESVVRVSSESLLWTGWLYFECLEQYMKWDYRKRRRDGWGCIGHEGVEQDIKEGRPWKRVVIDKLPQQTKSSLDCGVYCAHFARCIGQFSSADTVDFHSKDVTKFRAMMAVLIGKGKVPVISKDLVEFVKIPT